MQKKEIGRFQAISFDEKVYDFIVYNDNMIDCLTLNILDANRIDLKPRFVLIKFIKKDDKRILRIRYLKVKQKNKDGVSQLIGNYSIDEDLFYYLKEHNMITYSTDMAYLYGFPDKDGFDWKRHSQGEPFKRARKKGPILVKQRDGYFN